MVWLLVYLLLDFGSFFPYLAANAATPVAVVLLDGELPNPDKFDKHWWMIKCISSVIFVLSMIPLVVGGKVYNSLKVLMSVKLVTVLGFLLILAIFYSHSRTWIDIGSGFFKFGTVPVLKGEDANNNGVLDPGEDWDRGIITWTWLRRCFQNRWTRTVTANPMHGLRTKTVTRSSSRMLMVMVTGMDPMSRTFLCRFGQKENFPEIDFELVALIAALAAIAGNGGLTNTPVSNYTRDQGWGMGHWVGAIPSIIGGAGIELSHVGRVFKVTDESLERWRGWYRHVLRDQLVVWVPACFVGVALPSMLSVEFLRRGTSSGDWNAAAMTARGVGDHVANPPDDVLASITGLSSVVGGESWGERLLGHDAVMWFSGFGTGDGDDR